jgi:hypothetical protein
MKTFIQHLMETEVPASETTVVKQAAESVQIKPSGALTKLGGPCYPPFQRESKQ